MIREVGISANKQTPTVNMRLGGEYPRGVLRRYRFVHHFGVSYFFVTIQLKWWREKGGRGYLCSRRVV